MIKKQLIATIAALAVAISAQAAPFINGQISWAGTSPLDISDFSPASSDLSTPTSVNLASGNNALTITASVFNGGNDYSGSTFNPFSIPDLNWPGAFAGGFAFNGFNFSFNSITVNAQAPLTLGLSGLGFVSKSGFAVTPFQMSFSFSKTAQSSSVGWSGTISSGDNLAVPDAGGTVALLGMAIVGFAVFARRQTA